MESDDSSSTSKARGMLSRHTAAVEAALVAGALTGAACDVVVFDDQRAFRVASTEPNVLQPRLVIGCETELVRTDAPFAIDTGTGEAAFAIRDASDSIVGALTVEQHRTELGTEAFVRLARMVGSVIAAASDDPIASDMAGAVLEGLRDAVVVVDADLTIKWANQAVGSVFGRSAAEVVGQSAIDLLHPDDIELASDAITRLSQGLEMYRVCLRLERGMDSYERVEITGVDHTSHPLLNGIVLSLRAANAEMELEASLQRTNLMSAAIVAGLHDGIVATDQFGAITMVNHVARAMFGLDPVAPPASLALADFALLDADGRALGSDLTGGWDDSSDGGTDREVCVISARSELRHVTMRRREVTSADDELLGWVIAFHDVTEVRRASAELRRQALHDQLTGLANRRQLEIRLMEMARADEQVPVAVCFVDLDGFKLVNDTHGHRVGDELIRVAADRLGLSLRDVDLLVRQGGDEFVALLTGVDNTEEAVATAERLRATLSEPYLLGAQRFDLTASIGVALTSAAELGEDTVLRNADIALYAAKSAGRNRVELFDEELAVAVQVEELQRRMLREALDTDRVVMHFQPLVDSRTGTTYGYEALARCRDDDGGLVGPAMFMDAIANSGLMWDLDQTAFQLSCEAAAVLTRLQPENPPVIACNFSAIGLCQPDLVEFILDTTERHGVSPSQLCIEITESAAFDVGPQALAVLRSLHDRGFLLALDDFGTGYSSLAHLRDLPLTSVKVDRSFICRLDSDSSERSIAAAVVRLAADLGLLVVAEGVETAEQLAQAEKLGFSLIQGWYYAPAMSLTDVLSSWLSGDGPAPKPVTTTIPR